MALEDPTRDPPTKASLLRHIDDLPVLPGTVVELLRLDRRREDWFDQLVRLVEREPTYAARVLAMANSAAVRGRAPPAGIRDAVLRLGASATTDLVYALSVVRVFVPRNVWEQSLWVHALTVAALSRTLASKWRPDPPDPDAAYLCGLLHDIGRFVLFSEAPEALRRVDEAAWSDAAEMIAAERAICGLDHAALGGMAAERWGLPDAVAQVVRQHHQRPRGTDLVARLVAVVHAADRLDFFDVSPGHPGDAVRPGDDAALARRLRAVLPSGYPVAPEVLAPVIRKEVEDAHRVADEILPRGRSARPATP